MVLDYVLQVVKRHNFINVLSNSGDSVRLNWMCKYNDVIWVVLEDLVG